MNVIECPWCGVETGLSDGPTHRYLQSSPGCWARYGEVLSREYSDYTYMSVHSLTVDAYALQHPGEPGPQTISSLNVHLASLYVFFQLGRGIGELAIIKQQLTARKEAFTWLAPPLDLGYLNIGHVWQAQTAQEHVHTVKRWAQQMFEKWREHHATVAALIEKTV